MTVLKVEFFGGGTKEFEVLSGEINDQYMKQTFANITVLRDRWFDITDRIDKINDEFYLVDENDNTIFGGRLVTSNNRKSVVELEIGSFEEDALDAEPMGDTEERINVTDAGVVKEAIARVPSLSRGTIDQLSSETSFIFSNLSPASVIREMQNYTGAFVVYNPDKTIDYIENPTGGSSVGTVGPAEQNVYNSFEVLENEREDFTHLEVLGANEGEARITAESVVDSYDESSNARSRYRRYPNVDVVSEDHAQKIADNIVAEYENEPVRLKIDTSVFGLEIDNGSILKVESERDNIDSNLRVVGDRRILNGDQYDSDIILSNRLVAQEEFETKKNRDIERHNQGFQGNIVTINAGGFRASVDSDNDYDFSVRMPPDVVKELTAEIEIELLPFRYGTSSGVTETSDGPSDVEVYINDTLVADELNDFTELVDISGELDSGFNDVKLTSSSLGDLRATVFLDVYRQITQ